jgi:hypothetical protein
MRPPSPARSGNKNLDDRENPRFPKLSQRLAATEPRIIPWSDSQKTEENCRWLARALAGKNSRTVCQVLICSFSYSIPQWVTVLGIPSPQREPAEVGRG